MTMLKDDNVKARKNHICNHCKCNIVIGEVYRRTVYILDGEFCNASLHLDCDKVWLEKIKQYDFREDSYPFLCDDPDLSEDEEWIRKEYPHVAEKLFGVQGQAA